MQPSGMTQVLLTSKSRIAKRGLSIARQELVACVMDANIAANTNKALKRWPIIENYSWKERPFRGWKSFVSNHVKRIKQITDEIEIKWKHVPTKMNHADAGSQGACCRQLEKMSWWNG